MVIQYRAAKKAVHISKYVLPHPSKGLVQGVAVPAAVLLGGYIILTRYNLPVLQSVGDGLRELLKKISPIYPAQQAAADALGLPPPDPILGQWGNMWNDLANVFVPNIFLTANRTSGPIGSLLNVGANNLKPNTPFWYGWKPIPGNVQQFTANAKGSWQSESIIVSNPIGEYKIYVDQRLWGGKYAELTFRVTTGEFSF